MSITNYQEATAESFDPYPDLVSFKQENHLVEYYILVKRSTRGLILNYSPVVGF